MTTAWGIVLAHGVRTSRTMWRRQVDLLQQQGHEVRAIDFPGHGERRAEEFTLESASAVIQEATESLRTGHPDRPIAVAGLSLGGYLSLHWAARTDTPPDCLVLTSCTTVPGGLWNRAFVGVTHLFRSLPGDGASKASGPWARAWVGAEGAEDILAGGVGVDGQLQALRAMMACRPLHDVRTVVQRDIATTFLLGEWDHFRKDERAFRRVGREAAAQAGTAPPRWVLVKRANHLASLHRPGAYTRALTSVLAHRASEMSLDGAGDVPNVHAAQTGN